MNATAFQPGTVGGNREDLGDLISMLEPEETPFFSVLRKTKATALNHETLSERLDQPRLGGTAEGDNAPMGGNKATTRQRFGSYPGRFMRSFGVSDTQQAISKNGGTAGVANEYERDKMKSLREIKRDLEANALSNQETTTGAGNVMNNRGAFQWLSSSAVPAIPALFQAPAAQTLSGVTSILEAGANSLSSVLTSLTTQYGSGDQNFTAFVGTAYQQSVDQFTRTDNSGGTSSARFRINDSNDGTIKLTVNRFKSSFGTIDFVLDLFLRIDPTTGLGNTQSMLLAKVALWEWFELEPLHTVDLPPNAGGQTGYVKTQAGLGCLNPRGNAYIINT